MIPAFPIISIYKSRGLNIFEDDSKFRKISTYTFLHQLPTENRLYDKNGNMWYFLFINEKIKNDFKTRLLSNTFYNPTVNVDIDWKFIGKYSLPELIDHIAECVDKDEDVITQFEEPEVIKAELRKADSFEKIIQVLNTLVFKNFS